MQVRTILDRVECLKSFARGNVRRVDDAGPDPYTSVRAFDETGRAHVEAPEKSTKQTPDNRPRSQEERTCSQPGRPGRGREQGTSASWG